MINAVHICYNSLLPDDNIELPHSSNHMNANHGRDSQFMENDKHVGKYFGLSMTFINVICISYYSGTSI